MTEIKNEKKPFSAKEFVLDINAWFLVIVNIILSSGIGTLAFEIVYVDKPLFGHICEMLLIFSILLLIHLLNVHCLLNIFDMEIICDVFYYLFVIDIIAFGAMLFYHDILWSYIIGLTIGFFQWSYEILSTDMKLSDYFL